MSKATIKNEFTCEEVYNIWLSEPEVIKILDLRSQEEFLQGHIPGALPTEPSQVPMALEKLGNKLAVLIAPPGLEKKLFEVIKHFSNFVFLGQCHRWLELKYPLAGRCGEFKLDKTKGSHMNNDIIFHQLFEPESSTYTYIVADKKTKEAAIIDPVLETVERDLKLIDELGLKLIYVLDTHIHADHITSAAEIRKRIGAKTAVSHSAGVACADVQLEEGQELLLGDKKIKVLSTPGHTDTCLSYYFEGMVFTGDALLIRGCGRTDFQQGSSDKLFHSVRDKLFKLPDETIVYPAHDYKGLTSSTIETEKKHNARLKETVTLEDFKNVMANLNLAQPKKIHEAVPANLVCGEVNKNTFSPQVNNGIPEITVDDVFAHMNEVKNKKVRLIDVRRPDEFNNELGHIEGSELVTLGPDLTSFLEKGDRSQEIVFVCRSGARSGNATAESERLGYKRTVNMIGGMLRWNEQKLPTEKK